MSTCESPWAFKKWLANFEQVDLPIGDLAKDVAADKSFPDSDNKDEILSYLQSSSVHASLAALETFETVWDFYQASR